MPSDYRMNTAEENETPERLTPEQQRELIFSGHLQEGYGRTPPISGLGSRS